MARKRMIDPGFWEDEHLGGCSREARLLFIGLWTFSDDWGHVSVNAKKLKGEVFRYDDDIDSSVIRVALDELSAIDSIRLYVDGKHELAWIPRFLKYQRIDRPSRPQYELHPEQTDEDIEAIRRVFADYSTSIRDKSRLSKDKLSEEKIVEEKKGTRKPRSASAPPSPGQELVNFYLEEYQRIHQTKAHVSWGEDVKHFKTLLSDYTAEQLRPWITKYLTTDDQFYRKKGWPIRQFAADINGIVLDEGGNNGKRGANNDGLSAAERERMADAERKFGHLG